MGGGFKGTLPGDAGKGRHGMARILCPSKRAKPHRNTTPVVDVGGRLVPQRRYDALAQQADGFRGIIVEAQGDLRKAGRTEVPEPLDLPIQIL